MTIKAYIYITSIYLIKTGLFNQAVLLLINQEPFLLHQLVRKKVAIAIFIRYHLRNFLLITLHQRSFRPCRKKTRLLNHCRKELRLLGPHRKQTRSLGPRSRRVSLAIMISHCSPIDLPSLIKNRQALTSKSFPI